MTRALLRSTCGLAVALALGTQPRVGHLNASQSGTAAGAGVVAWKQAVPGRPIALPADHASHPEYKLEWWYYTGNLDGDDGGRYGFQVTFFRVGVTPSPSNRSRWAIRDLIMTHVAITDVRGRRYRYAERLNRPGLGWAGADTEGYRVWNEDWEASLQGKMHRLKASGVSSGIQALPFSLDLALEETQPPALHGESGYSRKGSDPGNASHYYSLPRMPTRGSLTIDGRTVAVTGLSWMDHEFGTSFLEPGQIGWDWFAIQLSDGRSVMLYRFRRDDGSKDPRSSGTLIDAAGRAAPIGFEHVTLTPGRAWTSPASAAVYPVSWRVSLPREKLELTIDAVLDTQELRTAESTGVTYWEGAIDVRGTANDRPIAGRGYLEMTGYSGAAMENYLR